METIILRKKFSPHRIVFTPDKDPFFCNIEIIKLRTGEVKGSHYVLASDIQLWRDMYSREGFRQVKEEASK